MSEKISYKPEIDGLRAVSVLAVIFFHAKFTSFSGGFVGVDVFFVISSYLITGIIWRSLKDDTFSFSHFYKKRFFRLYPALLTVVITTFCVSTIILPPAQFQELARDSLAALLSISNIVFYSTIDYFNAESDFSILLHTWSLSVEEQFYLIWPLFLVGTYKLVKYFQLKNIKILFIILFVLFSGVTVWATYANQPLAFFLTPFRMSEFLIGSLVFFYQDKIDIKTSQNLKNFLSFVAFIGLLCSFYFFSEEHVFPGWIVIFPAISSALLILFASQNFLLNACLSSKFMIHIGKLSYALYLVHWPIFSLTKHYTMDDLPRVHYIALIFLSYIIAAIIHYSIETKLRYSYQNLNLKKMLPITSTWLICIAAIISVYKGNGWLWRLQGKSDHFKDFLLKDDLSPKSFKKSYYGGSDCKTSRCATQPHKDKIDLIIIGDSYARAYFSAFRDIFSEYNIIFWESGACAFFSKESIGQGTKHKPRCWKAKFDAYEEIKNLKAKHIIIGQHWYNFSRGNQEYLDGTLLKMKGVDHLIEFATNEIRSLKKYLNVDKITILGAPPKFGKKYGPLDCVLSPIEKEDCYYTKRNRKVNWHGKFMKKLSKSLGDEFYYIDPTKVLCNRSFCKNFIDKKFPIYSDYGHLSIWGGEYVINNMYDEFKMAITR